MAGERTGEVVQLPTRAAAVRRGEDGFLRGAAQRFGEHDVRRWLLLRAADRVEALEHRLRHHLPEAIVGTLGLGVLRLAVHDRLRRRAIVGWPHERK